MENKTQLIMIYIQCNFKSSPPTYFEWYSYWEYAQRVRFIGGPFYPGENWMDWYDKFIVAKWKIKLKHG